MQVYAINNTPNFQANRLMTIKTASKNVKSKMFDQVDIYSIDKRDSNVINNLLMKLDLVEVRKDTYALREKSTVNNTIRHILNKALNLDETSKDGVVIAVKNNKNVIGLSDYINNSNPIIKNLTSWRGNVDNTTRKNLLASTIKKIIHDSSDLSKINDISVYTNSKNKNHKWLVEQGFVASKTKQQDTTQYKLDLSNNIHYDNVDNSQVELQNLDI